jgi:hypothetical protein
MTFAEYYLTYKLVTDPEEDIRILLMDRTLSGERTSLLYDTSKWDLWKVKANLIGYEVDGKTINEEDLGYGRYHVREPVLGLPPARADYLRYTIIYLVQERGPLTIEEICQDLGIDDEERRKRVERYLKYSVREGYLKKAHSRYKPNPRYMDTWDRLKKVVRTLGDRFFFEDNRVSARRDLGRITTAQGFIYGNLPSGLRVYRGDVHRCGTCISRAVVAHNHCHQMRHCATMIRGYPQRVGDQDFVHGCGKCSRGF